MRVIYLLDGKLMVSIFEDVSYYPKENKILFTSVHCDSVFLTTDNDTANMILFDIYEHGKLNLIHYSDKIILNWEI